MNEKELIALMSSSSGRALVYDLLRMSGYFTDVFDHDTIKHAYNAGRRSIGVELANKVKNADYDNYIRMLREHENVQRNDTSD